MDVSTSSVSQNGPSQNPQLFDFLKYQPEDLKTFWNQTFQKKNTPAIGAMIIGTGLLIAADQSMYEETARWGDKNGISQSGSLKTFFQTTIPGINYNVRLNGPYDLGSGLYFLGDGITHFTIIGSFFAYGISRDDSRALWTASQLTEAILANGIVVQILKHSTGRENPNTFTAPGGKWRFFPNQRDYAKHVNKYDAFPSGHLPTAMITVTVISENYPEYKWIRPLGYTLMTGLAFQMVNNGVHWYSDYPLSIYMGYAFSKIALGHNGRKIQTVRIYPSIVGNGFGLKMDKQFSFKKQKK
jgi:hypothetical protein